MYIAQTSEAELGCFPFLGDFFPKLPCLPYKPIMKITDNFEQTITNNFAPDCRI